MTTMAAEAPVWSIDLVGRPAVVDHEMTTVTALRGTEVFTALEPGIGRGQSLYENRTIRPCQLDQDVNHSCRQHHGGPRWRHNRRDADGYKWSSQHQARCCSPALDAIHIQLACPARDDDRSPLCRFQHERPVLHRSRYELLCLNKQLHLVANFRDLHDARWLHDDPALDASG